jgi:ribose-phosphate pyrophosphokinase
MKEYKLFSIDGRPIASEICEHLSQLTESDIRVGKFKIDQFSDGEFSPQFLESIRDKSVFLITTLTSSDAIVKLVLSIDAAKRASASEVIVILPYMAYSRQDRREGHRGAIGAKAIADLIKNSGADKAILFDLHSEQIQGFFDMPVEHIPGWVAFTEYVQELDPTCDWTVCSPDAGGVKRANRFYQHFVKTHETATFSMLSKLRDKPNSIERMDLIGDVNGRCVILIDDMVDTGGTLLLAAKLLKEAGALKVHAICTHGVLSGPAYERLSGENGKYLDSLVISTSIPTNFHEKIKTISCAKPIAKTIFAMTKSVSVAQTLLPV